MAPLLLEKLLAELRCQIYSYLLLDQNVTYMPAKGSRVRWRFEVNLFRVCKTISAESLHFFRLKNAFVSIDTNALEFLDNCQKAMPTFVGYRAQAFPYCALQIRFRSADFHCRQVRMRRDGRLVTFRGSPISLRRHRVSTKYRACAIIAARHLPNVVHLITTDIFLPILDFRQIKMNLTFRTAFSPFDDSPRIIHLLVEGLKGIYSGTVRGELTHELPQREILPRFWARWSLSEMYPINGDTCRMIVNFSDGLKFEYQKKIKDSFRLELTRHMVFTLANSLCGKGDKLRENGEFIAARGLFNVAYTYLIKQVDPSNDGAVHDRHQYILRKESVILHYVGGSKLYSCEGHHDDALTYAERALQHASSLSSETSRSLFAKYPQTG